MTYSVACKDSKFTVASCDRQQVAFVAVTMAACVQIDREADLLNRSRKPATLAGLRKRIAGLFLVFAETPEFNPEAASIQVVPADASNFVVDPAPAAVLA